MEEELVLDTLDEENQLSSFSVSVVIGENGEVFFPQQDLLFDKKGVRRSCGKDHSQIYVQITAKDLQFKEFLGKGVGGYVQKALYTPENLTIAVKTVNISDQKQRHQMLNDLRVLLVGSKSEFIVQCFGAYYEAEEAAVKIILEYMDIGSLKSLIDLLISVQSIQQTPTLIDEQMLATIAYQILMGMQFLHNKRKQVHRDIKPENILIDSNGNVKLADFGIAKELEKTTEIAKTFVGTYLYMSPERLSGAGCVYGGDVWSFGLVLLQLATGQEPYPTNQESFFEFIMHIQNASAPQLPQNSPYSQDLKDFLSLCLSKELQYRASVDQLIQHKWIQNNVGSKQNLQQYIQQLLSIQQNQNNAQQQQPQQNMPNLSAINANLFSNTLQLQESMSGEQFQQNNQNNNNNNGLQIDFE